MKAIRINRREKALNAVVALLILGLSGWAFLRYAPLPQAEQSSSQLPATSQPPSLASQEQSGARADEIPLEEEAPSAMMGFLGKEQSRGRVGTEATKYVEQLEASYIARGYRNFNGTANFQSHGKSGTPIKLYWRNKTEVSEVICAIGNDANPHDAKPISDAQMFLTVVTPDAAGGSKWISYLYSNEAPGWNSGDDFPGQDPPQIPRPDGMRRLFGFNSGPPAESTLAMYSSEREPGELEAWYRNAMSTSWHYEELASKEARELAERASYFSQRNKFCLIWVSSGDSTRSLVIISLHKR